MRRIRFFFPICLAIVCLASAGCGGGSNQLGSQPGNNGNSSVVLAMTDSPPSLVSVLSAQVTLTGASLNPGNISLLSGPKTVELTRLQTDVAYLATATSIPAGNYTGITLTFANPSLTIENDMAIQIAGCAVGTVCKVPPTSTANHSASFPLTSFTIASNSTTGLLIDVNLDNLITSSLSSPLGEDFSAGTSVTSFTPAGVGAPPVGAEDVVGQVGSVSPSNNTFTLTNATGSYSLKVDNSATFFQFPTSVCTTSGFSCLQNNQIVSVDIAMQSDGSILARNIVFEDSDSSDAEIEGMVTSTTNLGSQQFSIVIQTMSAAVSGLSIGQPIAVQYSTASPVTTFDLDLLHADNLQESTSGFLSAFAGPGDLLVGQQVSVRRNSGSTASLIKADRVRLRSTRLSGTVQIGLPNIFLSATSLIPFFTGHGITTGITAQTSLTPPTIYFEIGQNINASSIAVNDFVSVRGPLFNIGSGRTVLATKVVEKP